MPKVAWAPTTGHVMRNLVRWRNAIESTVCYIALTTMSAGGSVSVWSNHPELTRNRPVGLIPPAAQWFEEVRCGRTTLNSLETTCRPASSCITVVEPPELNRNRHVGMLPLQQSSRLGNMCPISHRNYPVGLLTKDHAEPPRTTFLLGEAGL